jgi:hypothetical protein
MALVHRLGQRIGDAGAHADHGGLVDAEAMASAVLIDAIERLTSFWRDIEVQNIFDAATNFWTVWLARLPVTDGPSIWEISASRAGANDHEVRHSQLVLA